MERTQFIPIGPSGGLAPSYGDQGSDYDAVSFLRAKMSSLRLDLETTDEQLPFSHITFEDKAIDFHENGIGLEQELNSESGDTKYGKYVVLYCDNDSDFGNAGGEGTEDNPFHNLNDALAYARCILEKSCGYAGYEEASIYGWSNVRFRIYLKGTVRLFASSEEGVTGSEITTNASRLAGRLDICAWDESSKPVITTSDDVENAEEASLSMRSFMVPWGTYLGNIVFRDIMFRVSNEATIGNNLSSPAFVMDGQVYFCAYGNAWRISNPEHQYFVVKKKTSPYDIYLKQFGQGLFELDAYARGLSWITADTTEYEMYRQEEASYFYIQDRDLYHRSEPNIKIGGWHTWSDVCGNGSEICFAVYFDLDDGYHLCRIQKKCGAWDIQEIAILPDFDGFYYKNFNSNKYISSLGEAYKCDFTITDLSKFTRNTLSWNFVYSYYASYRECSFTATSSTAPLLTPVSWLSSPSVYAHDGILTDCSIDFQTGEVEEDGGDGDGEEKPPFIDEDWFLLRCFHAENCDFTVKTPVLYDRLHVADASIVNNSTFDIEANALRVRVIDNGSGKDNEITFKGTSGIPAAWEGGFKGIIGHDSNYNSYICSGNTITAEINTYIDRFDIPSSLYYNSGDVDGIGAVKYSQNNKCDFTINSNLAGGISVGGYGVLLSKDDEFTLSLVLEDPPEDTPYTPIVNVAVYGLGSGNESLRFKTTMRISSTMSMDVMDECEIVGIQRGVHSGADIDIQAAVGGDCKIYGIDALYSEMSENCTISVSATGKYYAEAIAYFGKISDSTLSASATTTGTDGSTQSIARGIGGDDGNSENCQVTAVATAAGDATTHTYTFDPFTVSYAHYWSGSHAGEDIVLSTRIFTATMANSWSYAYASLSNSDQAYASVAGTATASLTNCNGVEREDTSVEWRERQGQYFISWDYDGPSDALDYDKTRTPIYEMLDNGNGVMEQSEVGYIETRSNFRGKSGYTLNGDEIIKLPTSETGTKTPKTPQEDDDDDE